MPTMITPRGTATEPKKLDLTVFTGKVLSEYERKAIGKKYVNYKQTNNVSERYYITGSAGDGYEHTPGEEMDGNNFEADYVDISLDDKITVYPQYIDKLDSKLANFNYETNLVKAVANKLVNDQDRKIFKKMGEALITTPKLSQKAAKIVVNTDIASTNFETKANGIINAVLEAKVKFTEEDIPEDGIVFITNHKNLLSLKKSQLIDLDVSNRGPNGDLTDGIVKGMIAGVEVVATNNLPSTVQIDKTDPTITKPVEGFFIRKDVVGMLDVFGSISIENDYIINKLSYFFNAYYTIGLGVLNPSEFCLITSE